MKRFFVLFLIFFSVYNTELISQCSYNLLNLNHVDCYGDNTGEIEISVSNNNSIWWWTFPDGTNSTNSLLTNLESGEYVINIMEFFDPTDTTSPLICSLIDTISIEQTIDITANFTLKNMC